MALALSCVGFSDDASQAFPRGGEVAFEFSVLAPGVVGFGCAGDAFGEELSGGGFDFCEAGDEVGSVGSFDLGAEVKA